MGDLVELNCTTTHDLDPDKVLQAAIGKVKEVLVIGEDEHGDLYCACSTGDIAWAVFACERGKAEVMGLSEDR